MSPRLKITKRDPDPVEIDEGGVLVKHCDNLPEAERLAREFMAKEHGMRPNEVRLPGGRVIWCRIVHCLHNNHTAAETGWKWMYQACTGPGRGIFRAVAFDCAFPHAVPERWQS